MACWLAIVVLLGAGDPGSVRVPLNDRQEAEVADIVVGLAKASGVAVGRPEGSLTLPMTGLAWPLSKALLAEALGADVVAVVEGRSLVLRIPPERLAEEARADWRRRLGGLVQRMEREIERRRNYGMHALPSYRPNDPGRPTICLIHGLNSTSGVFQHMVEPIEAAGYGLVVYDFPYNRDLDESAAAFRRDWGEFRKTRGDRRPWAIVAHSMGGLLARAYVEDGAAYAKDVASLILIAPVNGGSNLSKVQTIHQALQGLKAVQGQTKGDALARLGDGLGAAAEDMAPGSAFLRDLNGRKRRSGVPYHTLAGSGGFLSPTARRQIEGQFGRPGLGGLTKLMLGDLPAQLDEVTEGTGDGCVSLASTRLDGVDDHVTIAANHLELIRAPLLYPEPGPVACMPYLLRWLARDLPSAKNAPDGKAARDRQGLGPGGGGR